MISRPGQTLPQDAHGSNINGTGTSVTVIGAGGNIGSHLIPHLGRIPGLTRVSLVDMDRYEEVNRQSQDILPGDVGRLKVQVQGRKLRRINPALEVHTIPARVEDVPRGLLRSSLLIAAVDSRLARQTVNQIAFRLGIPWIDTGVDAAGLLVRVNVYVPGADQPCLECAWDDRDYDALEQTYPCRPNGAGEGDPEVAATNAPSSLGALAASLAVLECRKMLRGQQQHALVNRQLLIDARHHRHYVTAFTRNPRCRFDHVTWNSTGLAMRPSSITLDEFLKLVAARSEGPAAVRIQLEGQAFALRKHCLRGCQSSGERLQIADRIPSGQMKCVGCRDEMTIRGIDRFEQLHGRAVTPGDGRRRLSQLGFRTGDIVTVSVGDRITHIEFVNPL